MQQNTYWAKYLIAAVYYAIVYRRYYPLAFGFARELRLIYLLTR